MGLSDDEKAIIALTTRLGNRGRPSLSPGRWHALARGMHDEGLRPSDSAKDAWLSAAREAGRPIPDPRYRPIAAG